MGDYDEIMARRERLEEKLSDLRVEMEEIEREMDELGGELAALWEAGNRDIARQYERDAL